MPWRHVHEPIKLCSTEHSIPDHPDSAIESHQDDPNSDEQPRQRGGDLSIS